MARRVRSSALETRTAKLKLAVRGKPYWQRINEGLSIGYRRNATGSGSWSMRAADGRGSNWIKVIAPADDYEGTAGALSFWEAQRRAVELHHGGADDHGKLASVVEAIAAWRRDLVARGGDPANADRNFVPPAAVARLEAGGDAERPRVAALARRVARQGARPGECDTPVQVVVRGIVALCRTR